MNIGFTGTRHGLSGAQFEKMRSYLCILRSDYGWFHHGDCIGADAEAHDIAEEYMYEIVIHPPLIAHSRALKQSKYILEQKNYSNRNFDIANASDLLLACPKEEAEIVRSGTWQTIRMARKAGTKVIVIYPSGKTDNES